MDKEYVLPSVAMVLPQLDQTCSILTQEVFKRAITDYTKQLCEEDPEIADLILEGKKTLPRCILYVLQKAQQHIATIVEAMSDEEKNQLEEVKIQGISARMAGAAVEKEQTFQWAKDYYYGGTSVEPKDVQRVSATPAKKGKGSQKSAGNDKAASAKSKSGEATKKESSTGTESKDSGISPPAASPGKAKNPNAMDGGTQIALAGFAAVSQPEPKDEAPAA